MVQYPEGEAPLLKFGVNNMDSKIYNKKGEESGKVNLPESVFGVKWNPDLVHQVVQSMLSNARAGGPKAHTKDRGEVRGGGKKPWKQKGTGRARHGSRRSPIWVGGGVTFGPRKEKDFSRKINRKMRKVALYSVLSRKLQDGEVLFVDTLGFSEPKAKDARAILRSLGKVKGFEEINTKGNNTALIATESNDANTKMSFSNFGNVLITEVRNLNPVDLLSYKYLVIANPKESIKILESKSGGKKEKTKLEEK